MMTSQVTTENSVEQWWDDTLCYTWPETVVQRVDQMKSQVLWCCTAMRCSWWSVIASYSFTTAVDKIACIRIVASLWWWAVKTMDIQILIHLFKRTRQEELLEINLCLINGAQSTRTTSRWLPRTWIQTISFDFKEVSESLRNLMSPKMARQSQG